jgi:protein-tyrosine phosphatase
MGNICRSPSAQGVFEKLIVNKGLQDKISCNSAGTHSYHVGGSPDSRATKAALNRGIDISHHKARKISQADCEKFDYIVVMDNDNHMNVRMMCPIKYQIKIHKMIDFSPSSKYVEVPDPYYGGDRGFELVLDLLENANLVLLNFIQNQ